ncbi:exopolygalacturonase-like [Primulina tabacum]|uniref:exopolygalacturonase-like n=1 Tax=Primulina tabacum TaxID=48773 RepID=UPI003F59EE50
MIMKSFCVMIVPLLFFLSSFVFFVNGVSSPRKFFDVMNYGAVADGKTDDSQAFLKAWSDACEYHGRSRVWIPRRTFMLNSVNFEGPCNGSMAFLIKGTLKASTDPRNFFTETWIGFKYIDDLTVKGSGYLDGQGQAAWPYNDCYRNPNCKHLPATLRFDFVTNSKVNHLRSINSKNTHINLFACRNLNISKIRMTAPESSPNTDGIHIGLSNNIKISRSVIQTGDDCISMVSGSRNIEINDVSCGPGHGISVGSLGRSHVGDYVEGISIRNCTFKGADNGLRIKTWSPSLYSVASNITFEDIVMQNTANPILIDQQYCPFSGCQTKGKSSSRVQIQDVTFKNIRGVSSTQVAVNIQCSEDRPCKNVKLIDINLTYNGTGGQAMALCSHVFGSSYGKQIPKGCL